MNLPPPIRPATVRRHRRQFIGQVLLPVVLSGSIALAGMVLVGLAPAGQASLWADTALIWLILPLLLGGLLLLAALVGLILLTGRLYRATSPAARRIQAFSQRMERGAQQLADGISRPVLWTHQVWAALRTLLRR